MRSTRLVWLWLLALSLVAFRCNKSSEPTPTSHCPNGGLAAKIAALQAKPKGNPAYEIREYSWNGQKVYLASDETCCDQFITLYDECFNVLCAPSGGISGRGDGRCPDFYRQATGQKLVWRDPR
jgi:hypothetical protein